MVLGYCDCACQLGGCARRSLVSSEFFLCQCLHLAARLVGYSTPPPRLADHGRRWSRRNRDWRLVLPYRGYAAARWLLYFEYEPGIGSKWYTRHRRVTRGYRNTHVEHA